MHTGLALGFKAYYFDSVIPSKHGLDVPSTPANENTPELPKPENLVQKPDHAEPPQSQAQVKGDPNEANKVKKLVTRELEDNSTPISENNKKSENNSTADKKENEGVTSPPIDTTVNEEKKSTDAAEKKSETKAEEKKDISSSTGKGLTEQKKSTSSEPKITETVKDEITKSGNETI